MSSTSPAGHDYGAAGRSAGSARGRWDRRVIILTQLGVASGVLTFVTAVLLERQPMVELYLGVIFSVIIGTYLWQIGLATGSRAISFVVLSVLAWIAFFWVALNWVEVDWGELAVWHRAVITGGLGLIAAFFLVIPILVLFPFFRRPRHCLRAILVGGLAAIPLGLFGYAGVFEGCPVVLPEGMSCPSNDAFWRSLAVKALTLPLWQGAFACCFALGFPKPAAGRSSG